jgi:hypothetical protein
MSITKYVYEQSVDPTDEQYMVIELSMIAALPAVLAESAPFKMESVDGPEAIRSVVMVCLGVLVGAHLLPPDFDARAFRDNHCRHLGHMAHVKGDRLEMECASAREIHLRTRVSGSIAGGDDLDVVEFSRRLVFDYIRASTLEGDTYGDEKRHKEQVN